PAGGRAGWESSSATTTCVPRERCAACEARCARRRTAERRLDFDAPPAAFFAFPQPRQAARRDHESSSSRDGGATMHPLPRFAIEGSRGDVTLIDVVRAVMDVTQNEREVTAVILQMLQSGSIRLQRPLEEAL